MNPTRLGMGPPSRLLSYGLMAVAGLAATVGTARADSVLANNLTSPPSYSSFDLGIGFAGSTSNGTFTNETPAQEFLAQGSGMISQIVASVGLLDPGGVPLTVTVSSAAGSVPGAALGALTFATNQVSSNAFTAPSTFDFTPAHIALTAGQDYFVTFSVATPINGSLRYQALLLNTGSPIGFGFPAIDSPNGGSSWLKPTVTNEIGLTILGAAAVPEPGSLLLLTAGLLLAGGPFARWSRATPGSRGR